MTFDQSLYIRKNSKIHSSGLFAKTDIKKDTKIIRYRGLFILKDRVEEIKKRQLKANKNNQSTGAVYIFTLNDQYDINGKVSWNIAKYINHSCDHNCLPYLNDNDEIWITAIRDIEEGEELTYDYGYELDGYKNHPCHCGSKNCVGYIVREELRPELKRIENENSNNC